MKKLLAAVCAALAGLTIEAASINWENSNMDLYEKGTTTESTGYLAYFIDDATYSRTTALSDLASGNYATVVSSGYEADDLSDSGYLSGSNAGSFAAGSTANAYLVIFDASTAASATAAYVTDIATTTLPGSGVAGALDFDLSGSANAASWTSMSVPEPTSGLLMLLGMAGLALKRKRA